MDKKERDIHRAAIRRIAPLSVSLTMSLIVTLNPRNEDMFLLGLSMTTICVVLLLDWLNTRRR